MISAADRHVWSSWCSICRRDIDNGATAGQLIKEAGEIQVCPGEDAIFIICRAGFTGHEIVTPELFGGFRNRNDICTTVKSVQDHGVDK